MGLVKIEWEIGKSLADKLIIAFVYYFFRYFSKISINYKKLRSESRFPKFTDVDLTKRFYPFVFFFIIAPVIFIVLFTKYIPDGVWTVLGIVYVVVVSVLSVIFIIYLLYRVVIDLFASLLCLIKSVIVTTDQAFKFIKKVILMLKH